MFNREHNRGELNRIQITVGVRTIGDTLFHSTDFLDVCTLAFVTFDWSAHEIISDRLKAQLQELGCKKAGQLVQERTEALKRFAKSLSPLSSQI